MMLDVFVWPSFSSTTTFLSGTFFLHYLIIPTQCRRQQKKIRKQRFLVAP